MGKERRRKKHVARDVLQSGSLGRRKTMNIKTKKIREKRKEGKNRISDKNDCERMGKEGQERSIRRWACRRGEA